MCWTVARYLSKISIHAPRVGSDYPATISGTFWKYFNPRSPCGERHKWSDYQMLHSDFNPRSPCGERPRMMVGSADDVKISIHAPRVGSDRVCRWIPVVLRISIHAPRVGSDSADLMHLPKNIKFQSTLPVWGATTTRTISSGPSPISIHAPRVGSDGSPAHSLDPKQNFNPRSPCGERQQNCTNTS